TFGFEKGGRFTIVVSTNTLTQAQDSIDINQAIENNIKTLEGQGARNILTHNEKFSTPNGADGVKTSGTMQFPLPGTQNFINGKYMLLSFVANNQIIQQITLAWRQDDVYADDMAERILNSVELKKAEE